ncbi:MAG: hypothetical protein NC191_09685 [Muribaculaceae bacterium]|nr:hypothetical protein [Muribaculaceae bacterium]
MKNLVLLSAILLTSSAVMANEPLLLTPLAPATLPAVQATVTTNNESVTTTDANGVQITAPGTTGATFTPVSQMNPNMVPQNAAAQGKPVPQKRQPRVRIQTKQRSQGNSYWNAGGKGTKSFF